MALQDELKELRTAGFSDADIEAALGFSLSELQDDVPGQAPPQATPEQDDSVLIEEFLSLGGTEKQLLEAGFSSDPSAGGEKVLAFQQQQQSAEQERQEALAQVARETTGPQAFGIAAGQQFEKLGRVARGITGFATPDQLAEERKEEAERLAPLQEQRPISTTTGAITGAVGVGLLPGGLAAKVTTKAATGLIGARLAAITGAAAAGAVEESLIEGNPILGAAFGAGGQTVLPIVGTALKNTWKRIMGTDPTVGGRLNRNGGLTPSAVRELEDAGFTLRELGTEAERDILQQLDPETKAIFLAQLDPNSTLASQARQAEAAFFDSRLSGSRAGRDAELQALESQALTGDVDIATLASEALSQNQRALSGGAERQLLQPLGASRTSFNISNLADTGNRQQVADLVRRQLIRQKNLQIKDVSALYKVAKGLPGSDAPVNASRLTETLIANADRASEGMQKQVLQALAKFRVVGDNVEDLGLGNFAADIAGRRVDFRSAKGPEDLTIGNAEALRQELNKLSPTSNSDIALLQSLKSSLDSSTADAVQALPESAVKKKAFEIARREAARVKESFESNDIIEQLISFKDFNKATPQISDDVLVSKFMSTATPTASLAKLKVMLNTSGKEGKQMWNEFRAVSMEDFLKKSMQVDAKGNPVLSFQKLNNQLNSLGSGKLDIYLDASERKILSQLRSVLKNQDIPLNSLSTRAAGSGAAGNAITKVLGAITRIVTGSQVAGAAFDAGSTGIKHGAEEVIRRARLVDGLESVRGSKMTPKQKSKSITAKTQRFLQSLFEKTTRAEELARAPLAAAAGTEALPEQIIEENPEVIQNGN